jgi:hypothetical protein
LLKGAGFKPLRARIRNLIRTRNYTDRFPTFITILATQAISIARIWRGRYTRRAMVFQSSRLETRSSMPATFPKKAGPNRQLDYAERTASKALTAASAKG